MTWFDSLRRRWNQMREHTQRLARWPYAWRSGARWAALSATRRRVLATALGLLLAGMLLTSTVSAALLTGVTPLPLRPHAATGSATTAPSSQISSALRSAPAAHATATPSTAATPIKTPVSTAPHGARGSNGVNPQVTLGSLLWSYQTSSSIEASPTVANGVVYVGSDGWIYALDATSGVLLWKYQLGNCNVPAAPTVANGVVYVGTYGGVCTTGVYAFNAASGALLWSYQTTGNIDGSPTMANGVVYVGSDAGWAYALNATSGALLWSYQPSSCGIDAAPTVVNGVVYAGSSAYETCTPAVYALNAASGALLWSYPIGGNVRAAPVVVNGVVYVGSYGNWVYALNATSGALLWSYPVSVGGYGGPTVVNGVVYVGASGGSNNGMLYALNATSGALLWSYQTSNLQGIQGSPGVANGVVYVGSDTVYALDATTGHLLWKYPTVIDAADASPTVAEGVVYVNATNSYTYAFDAASGALLWSYQTDNVPAATEAPPTVTNGVVYLGSPQDWVYAFAATGTPPQPPAQGPVGSERNGNDNPSEASACLCLAPAGDPVDTYSGNFADTFDDLSIPGRGVALDFSHTYNAGAAAINGPLGYGWTDSYNWALTTDGSGAVTISQENGATVAFAPTGAGGYTPPSRVLASLVKNGDGSYTFLRAQTQDRYTFNASGQLTAETDRNGYVTRLAYNGSGQLTTVTDPAGRTLSVSYDGSGRITTVADSAGRSVAFTYDGSGNLQTATDVTGGVTVFTYDGAHLLLTMTDPRGGVTTNVYNGSDQVTQQTDPMARVTTFSYTAPDSNGESATTITDPNGAVTVDQYYNGLLLAETKGYGTPQAATWSYTYDPVSLGVDSITDPNGNTTTQTWDAAGNLLTTTDALGRTTTNTYDALNDLLTTTDANGVTTTFTYDAQGNLLSQSTPLVGTSQTQTTTYSYGDAMHPGDVTALTDPDGGVWRYSYDAAGDRVSSVDPLNDKTTATYDSLGRMTAQVSPRGNVAGATASAYTTRYAYDAFGAVTQTTDPLGGVTTQVYDANHNLTQLTDADGNVTQYTYDADNELTQTTRADGSVVKAVYDGDGNQVSQVDGAGNTTTYTYDPLNRLTSSSDPLGRVTTSGYDAAGNRTSVKDAAGQVTTFSYDSANQLTSVSYSDGQTPNVSYTYDADGQRLSMQDGTGTTSYSYDSLHRLTASTNGAGATVRYGYDLKGQLTSLTYPNDQTVTRGYDAAGRLTAVTDWNGKTSRFAYDADGNPIRETAANGVLTSLGYDDADRISSLTYLLTPSGAPASPLGGRAAASASQLAAGAYPMTLSYTRDALGQVTAQKAVGLPGQPNQFYTYSPLNQLTSVDAAPYTYDGAGDLTQGLAQGAATALTYDKADEVTGLTLAGSASQSFTYNANGDRTGATSGANTATYTYDEANRLTSYTTTGVTAISATYAYNGDGLRMRKTLAGGAPTQFAWQTNGALPLLLTDGGASFIYGPNDLPLEQINGDGSTLFFAQDQLGSTIFLTDSHATMVATYTYDVYGATVQQTGSATTPLQYAGQYVDAESGLIYLRARSYDPFTSQFLTRDPLESLTSQPYAYVSDDPLDGVDPAGSFSLTGLSAYLGGVAHDIGTLSSLTSMIAWSAMAAPVRLLGSEDPVAIFTAALRAEFVAEVFGTATLTLTAADYLITAVKTPIDYYLQSGENSCTANNPNGDGAEFNKDLQHLETALFEDSLPTGRTGGVWEGLKSGWGVVQSFFGGE